jgi:hypothetical protein
MTHPPRLATWLLGATLLPDADAIEGDLLEEFRPRKRLARVWYVWQVTRSLAPLFFRSWQRASVTRASVALVAAAAAATLPAAGLLSLRSFALSQVPLKTTAELSSPFALLLVAVVLATALIGFVIGARLLQDSRT